MMYIFYNCWVSLFFKDIACPLSASVVMTRCPHLFSFKWSGHFNMKDDIRPFVGVDVVVGESFVCCGWVFFNPSAIVSLTAGLCGWFPFWSNHVWCLWSNEPCCLFGQRVTAPELNQPFVCPHQTSLLAWQNTGLRLKLCLLRNWEQRGWKQVLVQPWTTEVAVSHASLISDRA